jgi:hypothetical protein
MKFLVCIDGSEDSTIAFQRAISLAQHKGDNHVYVVCVVEEQPVLVPVTSGYAGNPYHGFF